MNFDAGKLLQVVLIAGLLLWVVGSFIDIGALLGGNVVTKSTDNETMFHNIIIAVLVIAAIMLALRLVTTQSISKKSILMIVLAGLALWAVAKYLLPAMGIDIEIFSVIASVP